MSTTGEGENVVLSESQVKEQENADKIKLVDVVVADEIVALNLMVNFLTLAHRRGAFTLDEASKIWECVKKFQKN